jgi:nucleotide-binding universal stress UspA family protein
MVPLDGSTTAERSLAHAALLARLLDAEVLLARVPETTIVPVMSGAVWITEEVATDAAAENAGAYLDEAAARPELDGLRVATTLPPHPVANGLLQAIDDRDVDLVVMTTHGYSGFRRWVFGSVADKIVCHAPVDVFLIREDEGTVPPEPRLETILVPLDSSALAEAALPAASELAHRSGGRLVLVQIPTVPGYVTGIPETAGWIPKFLREQSESALAYLREKAAALSESGLAVDVDVEIVTAGTVAEGILASAREHAADVIVMSTHGRTGLGRWVFGSVADELLRLTDRPIWVVRADR